MAMTVPGMGHSRESRIWDRRESPDTRLFQTPAEVCPRDSGAGVTDTG
jgi:hypothetical protein